MELSERLWKTVLVCHCIWLKFRGTDRSDRAIRHDIVAYNGTNLCHGMRVVLLWAPLALLVNAVAYLSILFALVVTPILLFGAASYAVCFVIALALAGGIYWMCTHSDDVEDALSTAASATRSGIKTARIDSVFGLVVAYTIAAKRKICPIIRPHTQNGA